MAIGLEGLWATVYTPEGRRAFRETETEIEIDRLRGLLHERGGDDRDER